MIEAIGWLERLAGRLPELGDDGKALAAAVERWLGPHGANCNRPPAGRGPGFLAPSEEREHPATASDLLPGAPALRQATILNLVMKRYAASRWARIDRYRTTAPSSYAGKDLLVFRVLHANNGKVPSPGTIR